jgi:integrase/recombinase XerD
VVALKCKDVDLESGRCRVLGKGNKYRTVFFGHKTGGLLARLIRRNGNGEDGPLFVSSRGRGHFTRSGLLHLMKWLGNSAGIKDEVSLHVFRRSFAVQMLRNGANVFSVQAMLGHTNLTMTRRYCQVALADTEAQHRKFGPMDRLASAR